MKTIAVLLAEGFEECEALIVVDILRRAGLNVPLVSITDEREVLSSREVRVGADQGIGDVDWAGVDMIFLPGGKLGVSNLQKSDVVREQLREMAARGYIAAICAAPSILDGAGLLKDKQATCHPAFVPVMKDATVVDADVVVDGNIITGRALGATFEFACQCKPPFMSNEYLESLWHWGYVKVSKRFQEDGIKNIGAYICADLTFSGDAKNAHKAEKDSRLLNYRSGLHLYRCSPGIKRPMVTRPDYSEYLQEIECLDKPIFETEKVLCFGDGSAPRYYLYQHYVDTNYFE